MKINVTVSSKLIFFITLLITKITTPYIFTIDLFDNLLLLGDAHKIATKTTDSQIKVLLESLKKLQCKTKCIVEGEAVSEEFVESQIKSVREGLDRNPLLSKIMASISSETLLEMMTTDCTKGINLLNRIGILSTGYKNKLNNVDFECIKISDATDREMYLFLKEANKKEDFTRIGEYLAKSTTAKIKELYEKNSRLSSKSNSAKTKIDVKLKEIEQGISDWNNLLLSTTNSSVDGKAIYDKYQLGLPDLAMEFGFKRIIDLQLIIAVLQTLDNTHSNRHEKILVLTGAGHAITISTFFQELGQTKRYSYPQTMPTTRKELVAYMRKATLPIDVLSSIFERFIERISATTSSSSSTSSSSTSSTSSKVVSSSHSTVVSSSFSAATSSSSSSSSSTSADSSNKSNISIATKHCNRCRNEIAAKIKSQCSGCSKVHYCSRDCQRADWSRHRINCKKPETKS